MPKLEIETEELYMEIKYEKGELLFDSNETINFVRQLRELKNVTSLVSFTVEEHPPASRHFNYQFIASDGREWNQVLLVSAEESAMTFDVHDFWKLSEFVLHRPIRDAVLVMIAKYGVTEIIVTWN